MPDHPKFPFILENTAFLRLEFRRLPQIPQPLQTVWSATIRVDESRYPRFDVAVLAEANVDQPFSFTVEVIGAFNIPGGVQPPDVSIMPSFLTEQALFMLWPYVVQAVANASSQMGLPTVRIETPLQWNIGQQPQE